MMTMTMNGSMMRLCQCIQVGPDPHSSETCSPALPHEMEIREGLLGITDDTHYTAFHHN